MAHESAIELERTEATGKKRKLNNKRNRLNPSSQSKWKTT
jgi:hypothetical protein